MALDWLRTRWIAGRSRLRTFGPRGHSSGPRPGGLRSGVSQLVHPGGRRARAVVRASTAELLADCEAFVTGNYAEHLVAQAGRAIPPWAWTNLLAHGSLETLRAAADGGSGRRPLSGWRAARSYLASEVLARCPDASSLTDLQVGVLRPLELELCSRSIAESWDNRRWASEVLASLRCLPQHRSESSDAI